MKSTNKITFQVTIQSGKRRDLDVFAYARTDKVIYFKNGKYATPEGLSGFIENTIKNKLKEKLKN